VSFQYAKFWAKFYETLGGRREIELNFFSLPPIPAGLSPYLGANFHLCSLEAVPPAGPLHPGDVLRVRPVVASVEVCVIAMLVPPGTVIVHGASICVVVDVERTERLAEMIRHGIA